MVTTMCHFVSPVYHPSFPRAATAMKMVACTPDTGCYWQRKQYRHCYAMLCYAKSLQSCPTLCDPIDGSHQAPPSLGFSRQEHWSGLPFPSPMHESDKWKWSRSVVSDSLRPHGLQPIRLLHPWDFPGKSTGVGCHCLLHNRRLRLGKYIFPPLY